MQITLIPRANTKPLDQKLYTLPLKHNPWLRKELTDLEKVGIISPSASNFASPITIHSMKKDLSMHEIIYSTVAGFRKINEQLKYSSYPLMRIGRIISKLYKAKLYSTLDVRSDYYNITIDENSRKYSLF